MSRLNWESVCDLAKREATLLTKTKVPFQITAATEDAVVIRVRSGQEHPISRSNLEMAVAKIQAGVTLSGPKDYIENIADDRPSYAWAILKELGYLK